MSPYNARGVADACKLRRDNIDAGDYWIITDGCSVTIAHQESEKPAKTMTTIPRKEFNRLIRWYMREQKP